MLKINKLSKYNNNQLILNNISFVVDKREIVGLAGRSGSGKTTLLRCIQGLEKIQKGSIECFFETGFMFQDFQLFPHMTVLENLTYAPYIHKKKFVLKNATKLLKDLGLQNKKDIFPGHLSGGEKQRVALARALMMEPSLLLCDEPTSGLDVSSISDIAQLLLSVREMGISMLIASHDLEFLTKIADNIIILKNGELIKKDTNKNHLIDFFKSV